MYIIIIIIIIILYLLHNHGKTVFRRQKQMKGSVGALCVPLCSGLHATTPVLVFIPSGEGRDQEKNGL